MYNNYKMARNKSWEALIAARIISLPVKLSDIAKHYDIRIASYTSAGIDHNEGDGYCIKFNGRSIVFFNDSKPMHRVRFTIAHELGHCLLNHMQEGSMTPRHNNEVDDYKDTREQQANIFARDILMPATVLHSLNVKSAEEISILCNVSMQSAEIRYERILELNKRGMYNKHPLERQVHNQFTNYIQKVKNLQ